MSYYARRIVARVVRGAAYVEVGARCVQVACSCAGVRRVPVCPMSGGGHILRVATLAMSGYFSFVQHQAVFAKSLGCTRHHPVYSFCLTTLLPGVEVCRAVGPRGSMGRAAAMGFVLCVCHLHGHLRDA